MKICPKCQTRYPFNTRLCSADAEPLEVEDAPVGAVIANRYKLEKVLGKGGMGIVYLATHQTLGKKLALKFLRGNMADDPVVLKRFQREAKAASAIDHPGIVDVTDFGDDEEWGVFFTMEYVSGGALADLLEERTVLSPAEVVHIGSETAEALAAAHEHGIIHRDLKPDNIMLNKRPGKPPMPKIMDFGIAGMVDEAGPKLTMTGSVFGTPHYMSPEQAMGQQVDHRSDIYTLGVIIYEMAAGSRPFQAGDMLSLLEMHRSGAPEPPTVRNQGIPPGLESCILKCLEKDPNDRFQSMVGLAQALQMGGELSDETILPGASMGSMPAVAAVPTGAPPGPVPGSVPPGSVPPGSVPPGSVPPGSVPPGSVPPGPAPSSVPPGPPPGAQGPSTTGLGMGEVVAAASESKGGKGMQIAAAAVLALAVGGGGVYMMGSSSDQAAAGRPAPAAPAAPSAEEAAKAKAKAEAEAAAKIKAEAEAKARIEAEAKIKAEAEAKAKLEAEAKAKAEAEAQAKAEAEAKAQAKAEAEAKAQAEKPKKKSKKKRKKKKRGRSLLGLD